MRVSPFDLLVWRYAGPQVAHLLRAEALRVGQLHPLEQRMALRIRGGNPTELLRSPSAAGPPPLAKQDEVQSIHH